MPAERTVEGTGSGFLSDERLGEYMRWHRKRAGFTAKAAGASIGKSPQCIYNFERGANKITDVDLITLLDLYGVDPDAAFSGDLPDEDERKRGKGAYRLNQIGEIFLKLPDNAQRTVLSMVKYAGAYYGIVSEGDEAKDQQPRL